MMTKSSNFIFENDTNRMESNQNSNARPSENDDPKSSFSPRELIMYHIENPEQPITDDDIRNLNLKKQRVVDFWQMSFREINQSKSNLIISLYLRASANYDLYLRISGRQ